MPTRDKSLTLRYLKHLEFDRGRSIGTINSYLLHLTRLIEFLSGHGKNLLTASTTDLQEFTGFNLHEKGVSPRSRRPAIAAIRGFYRWARQCRLIKDSPAAALHYPSTGRKIPNAMPLRAVETILMGIDLDEFRGIRDAAIISVLAGCGLRVSGLAALNEADFIPQVDEDGYESAFLKVTEKGDHERLVPVPPEVLLMIRAYLGHPDLKKIERSLPNGDQVLFVNTRHPGKKEFDNCGESRRFSVTGVRRMIAKYGRQAGIPEKYCHPHALRHLYGTELVESDTDLLTVRQLMGHSSAESAKVYIHLSTRRLKAAVENGNPLGMIKTPVSGIVPLVTGK